MQQQEVGRRLSEAQRQHLTQLILAIRVASAKLEAANSIMQAQVEMAQKEFDSAQGTANAFLRYCGNELEVTFDDGLWGFDEGLMCFVRKEAVSGRLEAVSPEAEDSGQQPAAGSRQPMNGVVEHATNLT